MDKHLFPITDEMRMIFKNHYNGTMDSIQLILNSLKEKGYSQVQCVRLMMAEMKLSLVNADKLVMYSDAWSSEKEGIDILRENFLKTLLSYKPEDENGDDIKK
jgi:hypothetical protein